MHSTHLDHFDLFFLLDSALSPPCNNSLMMMPQQIIYIQQYIPLGYCTIENMDTTAKDKICREPVKDVYFLQVEKPLLYLTVLGGNSIWHLPAILFKA